MTAYAPIPADLKNRSAVLQVALISGFLLLALWFKLAVPYDSYFFVSNRTERLLHVVARIVFTAYLIGVFFGAGQWLLRGMTRHLGFFSLTACEEIAASVIAGSALIRICMFFLGFAKLYLFWLLAPLGALALAGASRLPHLLRLPQAPKDAPLTTRIARITLLIMLCSAIATVLFSKSLYPNGTVDYFPHYLQYYLRVIQLAGIWPNDLWYHFYVSKGVGDIFFAMIVSDSLAPLTVSFTMYLTGIAIGYAFLKRMTQNALASLLGSVMIAAAFIWTYQLHPHLGLWGEFSEQHVITAVLFWGTVWAGWLLQELPLRETSVWRNVTAAITIGLVVLEPQFAALCCVYFMLLAVVEAHRRSPLTRTYVSLVLIAAITAATLLTINYVITGLADVTPYRFFWKFANQERFSHWVSPFLMLTLLLGASPEIGVLGSPPEFAHYRYRVVLALVFRLNLVLPYILPLLAYAFILVQAARHKSLTVQPALLRGLTCLMAMLLAAVVLFFCINLLGSTFRVYMFCLYPLMVIVAIPFALAQQVSLGRPRLAKATVVGMVLIGLYAVFYPLHQCSNKQKWQWLNFALGKSTIARAYEEQELLWKPGIAFCNPVPPNTRVWSSRIIEESPNCRFETFFSYSMGRDFAVINFDEPDKAEAALRKQKLNYFLIDTHVPFFDLLPYSPLFSPEQIVKHLGVVWSQDGVYLLAWRSPKTKPLPPEFFASYRQNLANKWPDFQTLHNAVSRYYFDWKFNPHWPIAADPGAPQP